MTTFHCADDVLTLLIHLGYLAYDSKTEKHLFRMKKSAVHSFLQSEIEVGMKFTRQSKIQKNF